MTEVNKLLARIAHLEWECDVLRGEIRFRETVAKDFMAKWLECVAVLAERGLIAAGNPQRKKDKDDQL